MEGKRGQLGRESDEHHMIDGTVTPERVIPCLRSAKLIAISAGTYASFAVDDRGHVWGWGLDSYGHTGTNNFSPKRKPPTAEHPTKWSD